jgi:hypothetical protein
MLRRIYQACLVAALFLLGNEMLRSVYDYYDRLIPLACGRGATALLLFMLTVMHLLISLKNSGFSFGMPFIYLATSLPIALLLPPILQVSMKNFAPLEPEYVREGYIYLILQFVTIAIVASVGLFGALRLAKLRR